MKSIRYVLLGYVITTGALLGDLPFVNWPEVVQDAAHKEKLVITSGHTGGFGGVHTSSYTISLGQKKEGDAALILFDACSQKLHEWASKNGAQHSTTNSLGGRSLRIKALSGHYLSTIYQPPKQGATQGTFNIVFVEPTEFLQAIDDETNKPSEQGGTGQPATRPESKSEGGDKPQPEAEGRSK
jgi:hypothetical protein